MLLRFRDDTALRQTLANTQSSAAAMEQSLRIQCDTGARIIRECVEENEKLKNEMNLPRQMHIRSYASRSITSFRCDIADVPRTVETSMASGLWRGRTEIGRALLSHFTTCNILLSTASRTDLVRG